MIPEARRITAAAPQHGPSAALTIWIAAAILLCAPHSAAQQAQSSQPPAATERQSSSDKPAPPSATPDPPKPAQKRKVITNEDIEARHAEDMLNLKEPAPVPIYGSLGECDADCESEVRGELGYTEDREGEWQIQIALARREIAADRQWHSLVAQASQYVRLYCMLQQQEQAAASPSGNDYRSRVERAENQQNFESADRTMRARVDEFSGRLNQRIEEVSSGEPVREAAMRVIAGRVINNCPPPAHR